MKKKERNEARLLREAIDEAIIKQLAENQSKPSVHMNKENKIRISVFVDAVPLFKEEKEALCDYLRDKWLFPEDSECDNIIGSYFTIRKCIFQNKYKVSSKNHMDWGDDYFS